VVARVWRVCMTYSEGPVCLLAHLLVCWLRFLPWLHSSRGILQMHGWKQHQACKMRAHSSDMAPHLSVTQQLVEAGQLPACHLQLCCPVATPCTCLQGADIYSSTAWRVLTTLLRAFRAAMCGMPVPPVKLVSQPVTRCHISTQECTCAGCLYNLLSSTLLSNPLI
jgi:hypothetical protein